jgi:hypothetical protein
MNKPKIAFVKQEVYQDLYVCATSEKDTGSILCSSMGRVGPIALMSDLGADFYIVKEEPDFETQIYKRVIPHLAKHLRMLKTQTLDKVPGQEFKCPGSPWPNGKFAVSCEEIDWGAYDIVVSVNVSLPERTVRKYPSTLFCYMIGEANMCTRAVHFGYDVTLNQMARGIVAERCGVVDFPYTFVDASTLENIMRHRLGREPRREGVFMEINSTKERPVTRVPDHFRPLEAAGQRIILHKQKIEDNLTAIYDSKYFVKMGGRTIRGNSVAEAVSLGSLAIMDKRQVIHRELILDECDVRTMDDTVRLINRLESDGEEYRRLVAKQREVLHRCFFEAPMQSLVNCLDDKRSRHEPKKYTWTDKLRDRMAFFSIKH